jgi:hypothetical protein
MVSFGARLAALDRRAARATRPRDLVLICHPGQPIPSPDAGGTIIVMPCNGRAPCAICDAEAARL